MNKPCILFTEDAESKVELDLSAIDAGHSPATSVVIALVPGIKDVIEGPGRGIYRLTLQEGADWQQDVEEVVIDAVRGDTECISIDITPHHGTPL